MGLRRKYMISLEEVFDDIALVAECEIANALRFPIAARQDRQWGGRQTLCKSARRFFCIKLALTSS
jgi:hypothetical protein